MIDPSVIVDNLLSPAVLCFVLGITSQLIKGDLKFPEALTTTLSMYLLFAIGLKGGMSLRESSEGIVSAAFLTIVVGSAIPFAIYGIARKAANWPRGESASLAAHYGSTSAVTFLACIAFLERTGQTVEGYVPALLAIMEVPAIVVGMALAQKSSLATGGGSLKAVLHHVLAGKTVVLLIGGMIIGAVSSEKGLDKVMPFFKDPFAGILALYLLELGLLAGSSLWKLRGRLMFLLCIGILSPLIFGGITVSLAHLIGMSAGGATALGILAGSASYIAAPAAMRMACPRVDHGIPLSASLGITFPFNLSLGIPILSIWSNYLA